jgi:hypothetical protein
MQDEPQNENDTQNGKGIESLVQETIEHMPRVNETIIENLSSKEKDDNPVQSDSASNVGNESTNSNAENVSFDPAIHEVNADGTPRKTADGKYRKKRGRRSGNTASTPNSNPSTPKPPPVDYTGLAHMALNMVFGATAMFLGPHWKPSTDEYNEIHKQAVATLEYYEMPVIPPPIALAIVVGMYGLPRWFDPRTQQTLDARNTKPVENEAKRA